MAVYEELGAQAKKEFSHFNIRVQHSGTYDDIVRSFSGKARNVFLFDRGEDEIRVEKDGITDISLSNFTLEEFATFADIMATVYDRAVKGEIIDHSET